MLIVLPLDHVINYRYPWVLQVSPPALEVQNQLKAGFKHPEIHGCGKSHDLEGTVHGIRDPKEEWSWSVLFKFIEAHKNFPPYYAI